MSPEPLYILGAGMHPWGKWGNDFTEYGVAAARAALAEAGLDWRQIQLVAGADTIRNGYPGFVAGATFAQKLGWNGVPVSSSYAACASGSQALQSARAQILAGFCDVALVIGADTTPKGFFAPVGGERKNDPDWQRFHLIGAKHRVRRADQVEALPVRVVLAFPADRREETLRRGVRTDHQRDVAESRQDLSPRALQGLRAAGARRVARGDGNAVPAELLGERRARDEAGVSVADRVGACNELDLAPVKPGLGERGARGDDAVLGEVASPFPHGCMPAPRM